MSFFQFYERKLGNNFKTRKCAILVNETATSVTENKDGWRLTIDRWQASYYAKRP